MTKFEDRSTSEILVLMIAGTICGAVLFGTVAIVLLALVFPDFDYNGGARTIADLLTTLVGLLAGYLAGRSGIKLEDKEGDDPTPPG